MLDVLLVEPSKAMVQIYKNMIPWELYGFTIASVCDSEQQAISYYGEYNYALVICDLRLAAGDGLSLIRKLRELDAHCQIAVISDQCDYASLRSAFRLHVIDFLQKKEIRASSLLDLLLEVRSHYERESEPSPQAEVEKLLGHVRDHQTIDETLFEERLAQAGGSLLQQPYVLVYVRMDNVRQINRKLKIYDHPDWISESEFMMLYKSRLKQREELRRSIMKCISTQLQLHPYLLWLIKRHSALLLIPYEKRDAFLAQAERLKAALESECRAEFSITVSALKTQGGGQRFWQISAH